MLAVIASCFPNRIEETKTLTLANKAAGKVIVGKIGTSPITLKELFDNQQKTFNNKIFDIKLLCKKLDKDRQKGLKLALQMGVSIFYITVI